MTVRLENVSKRYAKKKVLDSVSVTFGGGRIHALFGENGAGKSTLVGILSGSIPYDSGKILIDGRQTAYTCAKEALSDGIVLVHQNPLLAGELTAAQNIRLTGSPDKEVLRSLHEAWAPQLDVSMPVKDMGGNQRFYTALLCALLKNPSLLILDEPSAFLDVGERTDLYGKLRKFCENGASVVVITHSAAEASLYADTVTVLKDGRVSAAYDDAKDFLPRATAESQGNPGTPDPEADEPCLLLEHISCRPKSLAPLFDVSIRADFGAITAVTGMQEPSLETLEDIATGMARGMQVRGNVAFRSERGKENFVSMQPKALTAAFLRKNGAAIVPSNRKFRASHPSLTVREMLFCAKEPPEVIIQKAGIDTTPDDCSSNLSGGMLQRLILAREQSLGGNLFILCNPMQGLDGAAQASLARTMVTLARQGKAVLVIGAADVPLSLCSRVYQLEEGTCTLAFQKRR